MVRRRAKCREPTRSPEARKSQEMVNRAEHWGRRKKHNRAAREAGLRNLREKGRNRKGHSLVVIVEEFTQGSAETRPKATTSRKELSKRNACKEELLRV